MSESNGLLDRITRVEGFQNELVETLQAIGQVVGVSEVQTKLSGIKRDKMSQLVTDAVKSGRLEPTDVVAKNSFIVGQQLEPTGTPLFPGRFQLFVSEIAEEVRENVIGKKVGDFVATPDGGKVKVEEIYVTPEPKKATPKKVKRVKAVVVPTGTNASTN